MKIYTDKDWQHDRTLSPKIGQYVANEIIDDLRNSLPPQRDCMIFQPGEPYTHDVRTGLALFQTFELDAESGNYRYIGLRP